MPQISLTSDMTKEIVKFFNDNSVIYDKKDVINARRLLAQYFYVVERMIPEIPRSVHFSSELSTNLTGMDSKWANFVQNIKQHFEDGRDVLKFLSKGALNARSQDGLLTDFGIHHLHLGNKRSESETFVERSDYLLFVFIESSNVYFLDLRRHPNANIPGDYGWSDQDYLKIMQSNWPEVLRKYSLKRATGTIVSDEQKKTLQELNINVISSFGGEAIFSPGGGLAGDGSNMYCQYLADRLVHQVENIQNYIEENGSQCATMLREAGVDTSQGVAFQLVRLGGCGLPQEKLQALNGELSWSGWGISETVTRTLIDWHFQYT